MRGGKYFPVKNCKHFTMTAQSDYKNIAKVSKAHIPPAVAIRGEMDK